MSNLIQLRGGSAAWWTEQNPVLHAREVGIELGDVMKMKAGDGVRAWNDLPYVSDPERLEELAGLAEAAAQSAQDAAAAVQPGQPGGTAQLSAQSTVVLDQLPASAKTTNGEPPRGRKQNFVTFQDFGAVCDGRDESALIAEAINYADATGLPIKPEGLIGGTVSVVDKSVRFIKGSGKWLQQKGQTPLTIEHTMLGGQAGVAVSQFGTLIVEGAGDREASDDSLYQWYNTVQLPDSAYGSLSLNQGDVLKLSCDDVYAGDYLASAPALTFISEYAKVTGVVFRTTLDVGQSFTADTMVTGATSGATGYVAAVRREYGEADAAKRVLFVNAISGQFAATEPLIMGGTQRGILNSKVVAVPLLMNFGKFTTNPVVHKLRNDLVVDVDQLAFTASADPDNPTSSGERAPAVLMRTVNNAQLNLDVTSSWRQGIRLISCYGFDIDVRAAKLPGYAEDSVAGWGYLVEAFACCQDGRVRVFAENVRHAFTTNVRPTSTAPTAADTMDGRYFLYAHSGVAARISVTGRAFNCTDAAFDTHGGSMFIRFHDFHVSCTMPGARSQGRPTGIQNRSFGTTIENGLIEGVVDGIRDVASYFPSPFKNTTQIRDVVMRDIIRFGVANTQEPSANESQGFNRLVVSDCDITHRSIPNVTGALAPNKQAGLRSYGGRVEMHRVNVRGSNQYYAHFSASKMVDVFIHDGLYDISDSPNQPYGVYCDNGDFVAGVAPVIYDLKFRVGTWAVPTLLRSSTLTATTTLRTSGCGAIDSNTAVLPISGGGAINVAQLRNGTVELRGASSTRNSAAIAAGASETLPPITVTGAALGDFVSASYSRSLAGIELTASVTAANTVTATLRNPTGASVTLGSGTVVALVRK